MTALITAAPTLTPLRRQQIAEALGDLETIFFDPDAFGDTTSADCATSLSAEFDCGPARDDEVVSRLAKMIGAEASGDLKAARRHLTFVRRKLLLRFGVTPAESVTVIPDAEALKLARGAGC
jgi:hypothetical protein